MLPRPKTKNSIMKDRRSIAVEGKVGEHKNIQ